MANNFWLKLYIEMLEDPKVGRLSDGQFRTMINCFLLAGEVDGGGDLIAVEDMAWRFRKADADLIADLQALQKVGILDEHEGLWFVTNFEKRQARIKNAEKQQAYRERQRKDNFGNEPVTEEEEEGNVIVIDGVTDCNEDGDQGVTVSNKGGYQGVTDGNTDKIREDVDIDLEKDEDEDADEDFGGGGFVVEKSVDNLAKKLEFAWNELSMIKTNKIPESQLPTYISAFKNMADCGVQPEDLKKSWGWYKKQRNYAPYNPSVLLKPAQVEMGARLKAEGGEINVRRKSEFEAFIQH